MARFDCLKTDSPFKKVQSFLMMTWREWLLNLTVEEFIRSDYLHATADLLNDSNFIHMIKSKELNVKVMLHPFIKFY